jgi:hypothetical protein
MAPIGGVRSASCGILEAGLQRTDNTPGTHLGAVDINLQQRPHGSPQRHLQGRQGAGQRVPKRGHLHHHHLPDRRTAPKPVQFHLIRRGASFSWLIRAGHDGLDGNTASLRNAIQATVCGPQDCPPGTYAPRRSGVVSPPPLISRPGEAECRHGSR